MKNETFAAAVLTLGVALLICGCSSTPSQRTQSTQATYSKEGATQQQFMKDRSECIQQAQQKAAQANGAVASGTTFVKCDAVPSCLAARGYVVNAKGSLAAPPGTDVACVN